jgi:Cu+-exporting ATPase
LVRRIAGAARLLATGKLVLSTGFDGAQELRDEGLRIVMLIGDNRTTAEVVARKVGIDEVQAEILPDRKKEVIRHLQTEGRHYSQLMRADQPARPRW